MRVTVSKKGNKIGILLGIISPLAKIRVVFTTSNELGLLSVNRTDLLT